MSDKNILREIHFYIFIWNKACGLNNFEKILRKGSVFELTFTGTFIHGMICDLEYAPCIKVSYYFCIVISLMFVGRVVRLNKPSHYVPRYR